MKIKTECYGVKVVCVSQVSKLIEIVVWFQWVATIIVTNLKSKNIQATILVSLIFFQDPTKNAFPCQLNSS